MVVRFRADWAVVVAAWALLVCATTLLTAGTLYGDTVALGGVRAAVDAAPAADRVVVVRSNVLATAVEALDEPVTTELGRLIDRTGGEVVTIVRTDAFAQVSTDNTNATTLFTFAGFGGIEKHAALVAGRWATSGAATQEATLSEGAAAAIGLAPGDHLELVGRLDSSVTIDVVVVGIWHPAPDDPYWLDAPQELDGIIATGGFTSIGPLTVPLDDLASRSFGARRSLEWRGILDTAGLRLDDLAAIRADTSQLQTRLDIAASAGSQLRVQTRLAEILGTVSAAALVSRTGVLLLVLQFAVLAAYAIVLVAGMLADRRRAETALMRSRGASTGHLAAMTILEAVLLAALAAAIAPFLALGAVQLLAGTGPLAASDIRETVRLSPDALLVDGLTAIACVVALTTPMLGGFGNIAGVRAAIARQAGRTLAQRLGLDLALVIVAGLALWQLRLYGAPLTRNARGVLGVDPLLVAAPGIGLLAGAVVATRIIPRIAEVAERLLQRDRGLVGAMGGRGLARRPLRYTRSALLLMLAAALGTFASAHVATWTRSQADQAAYQAGADLRFTPSQRVANGLVVGATLRDIDGVVAAMPVDRLTVDSGRGVRGGPLLAVDAQTAADMIAMTPDADGPARAALLAELAAARPAPVGVTVPDGTRRIRIVVSPRFEPAFTDPNVPPPDLTTFEGVRGAMFVTDGDGRMYRLAATTDALLVGDGQTIDVDLPATTTTPLRIRGIELGLDAPQFEGIIGTIAVDGFRASPSTSADVGDGTWTALDAQPGDSGWGWQAIVGNGQPVAAQPADGAPWQINVGVDQPSIDPVFGGTGSATTLRLTLRDSTSTIAAIASRQFLTATGAVVGGTVTASFAATSHQVRIIGVADTFPTLDPTKPWLVLDGPTLAAERFTTVATVDAPSEWWLSATASPTAAAAGAASARDTDGTRAAAIAAAVVARVDPAATILSRASREQTLLTDPVPLGVIGVLGLGSVAAMVFAAIGFVVAATISTRERLGEFALLRALGLSGRELSTWLSLENAFLMVVGIVSGLGLGALLAIVVLPVSTLTSDGSTAVPTPIVELPLSAVLPVIVMAGLVFIATMLVLRRQLLQVRIGDVLRGRDE